ncbi:helix-turn-helix domain-containing protein [Nonomuraea typhae]|uniref:helix-turn-helix domain-containing protein n=1 Tax=Nonomuraea typhae TaxID=2603600 RepID=UPI0012FBC81D|nr:helix-turn-helix transcriptional regulator [Nonomuraea typhae]
MNHHLRAVMAHAQMQPLDLAAHLGVDPKTVSRWLKGRIPYPRHRVAIADCLGVDEADLWPEAARHRHMISSEVRAVYPHRWAVPHGVWRALFANAMREIDILTYSALFLAENPGLVNLIAERARAGVQLRILLGDPDSPEVAARGRDEGTGADVMTARVRNALTLFGPLQEIPTAKIRLHRTVLYNSIYRADNDLFVNIHAYGTKAPDAPVIHLHHADSHGAAAVYLTGLERVWTAASSTRGH